MTTPVNLRWGSEGWQLCFNVPTCLFSQLWIPKMLFSFSWLKLVIVVNLSLFKGLQLFLLVSRMWCNLQYLKVVQIAVLLVLEKCYDNKTVSLPFYLFISPLIKPEATNHQKRKEGDRRGLKVNSRNDYSNKQDRVKTCFKTSGMGKVSFYIDTLLAMHFAVS